MATVYNGNSNKFGSLPQFSLANTANNANLKPEQTTAQEGGLELSILNDRLTFDGTYYVKKTRDQIIPLTTAPATGFSSAVINAGQISNRGFEASVTARPVRLTNGFTWNTTFNYLRNRSKVDSLYPGLATIIIASQWSSNIEARQGQPYGVLFGYAYLRDSATGKRMLSGGLPLRDPTKRILGNVNPDWTGGWANEFRYKSVAVNVLVDFRRGGQNFSVGNWWGQYAGILASTLEGSSGRLGQARSHHRRHRQDDAASPTRFVSRRRTTTTPSIRSTKPASSTRASRSSVRCASAGMCPDSTPIRCARRS